MQLLEENYENKYRLDLAWYEYNALVTLIQEAKERDIYIDSNLLKKVENYKTIKLSYAKLGAVAKASSVRSKRTKEKFESAVVALSREGSELTAYKIAKRASISFATAKKYLNLFNEN